ncbi:MAG: magnesium/cobalt transporter CorA [Bacteroidota bacterium]|nr:magnesium/cobalt transporter CorA [Bacteroidota bacterium]MDP4195617.1 magnesium/cobalt transporter CorA [Bacteroidota bacterium]
MKKLIKNSRKKIGQAPGSLIYMGEISGRDVSITLSKYMKDNYQEKKSISLDEISELNTAGEKIWVNIDGIHNTEIISKIGEVFKIHPLSLEDILNTGHRPKTEDLGDYIFVVLKDLAYDHKLKSVKSEQMSLVITENCVISFQEDLSDDFQVIRESLRENKGRIRELGPDYLAYRMLDVLIDNYFNVLEHIGDQIEALEAELIENPTRDTLQKLYKLKNDMIMFRRAVWPLREVVSGLEKIESPLIANSTQPYLRDLYDHVVQLIDTNENYRDMVAGMMDIYLSSISNRLNEVMKILTIISTFFIPLNFIAGLYGMNFNTEKSPFNMPELNFYWGYPTVLLVMLIIAVALFIYFKRKRWF